MHWSSRMSATHSGPRLALVATRAALRTAASPPIPRWSALAKQTPWTCMQCRFRNQLQPGHAISKRWIASTTPHPQSDSKTTSPTTLASPSQPVDESSASTSSLPSHTAKQRWELSDRMNKLMDNILARASLAGQHINAYTGTDYSGIESIRKSIIAQEEQVKVSLQAVERAKSSQLEEMAKQASSQKEIVSLLERKASWSPSDLERYMALVRSEHINEQATQGAKDGLATAERELENARALLEKLERKQYHEEQVWSDTIRRNSTWVTFGLMGVNIVLLLAQIIFFEPYRRKKIVRDVKAALDEKTLVSSVSIEEPLKDVAAPIAEVVVETAKPISEESSQPLDAIFTPDTEVLQMPLPAREVVPEKTSGVTDTANSGPQQTPLTGASWDEQLKAQWHVYQEICRDLFSDRMLSIKKVDLTTIALQGAVVGATSIGFIVMLLRSR
ncbi:Hypothetical protein R9X50_00733200 [Acrodontium crateriforme]|uniref:Sensitive to high expression protein 9, mitochondrial n=1 Tax=Acrodontium crateriforme TaxID=150365 RepID=A0AAQ3RC52_9PEZI|nr:Hypothetical protein R9X50_00733200 [Acrodontium crateriforme]